MEHTWLLLLVFKQACILLYLKYYDRLLRLIQRKLKSFGFMPC